MPLSQDSKSSKGRRKHKNSKFGCPNCKKRRVKCSEDMPSCLNCIKHKVKCGYLDYTEVQLQEIRLSKIAEESEDLRASISNEGGRDNLSPPPSQLSYNQNNSREFVQSNSTSPETTQVHSPGQPQQSQEQHQQQQPQVQRSSTSSSVPQWTGQNSYFPSVSSSSGFNPTRANSNSSILQNDNRPSIASGRSASSSYYSLISGVNNALMIDQREVTQNFDNLLPKTADDPENSIIYPVYSINGQNDQLSPNSFPGRQSPSWQHQQHHQPFQQQSQQLHHDPLHHQFQHQQQVEFSQQQQQQQHQQQQLQHQQHHQQNSQHHIIQDQQQYFAQQHNHFQGQQNSQNTSNSQELDLAQKQYFASTSPAQDYPSISQSPSVGPRSATAVNSPHLSSGYRCLPGAIPSEASFPKLQKTKINHINLLLRNIILAGPKINQGTCPLEEIRDLYTSWINSFIYRSYDSHLMFSVLVNFSTNYLISNCLQDGHQSVAFPSSLRSKMKNSFIVISIKHYGRTIKLLREVLNSSKNPELCSSTSYILSLMSIYDPEATLNSINCFRDGLFSVLSHYLHIAKKNSEVKPTLLIPSHLQLMKNIEKSVYLPGYDPQFLNEYLSKLYQFGEIKANYSDQSHAIPMGSTMEFLNTKYNELLAFTSDTAMKYLPLINGNMNNIKIQQETLFEMVHRWVRLFPSRFLVVTRKSHPFEKVLYLFYKTLKKVLYALAPQVKFFFLRDFESPLMTEVFAVNKDFDIFQSELTYPLTFAGADISSNIDAHQLETLRLISAYLIRVNSYLQRRLSILYRFLVVGAGSGGALKIDDIRKWRSSVKDISLARTQFSRAISLEETNILSFENTIIEPKHYPRLSTSPFPDFKVQAHGIDLNRLQASGLLSDDFDPIPQAQ